MIIIRGNQIINLKETTKFWYSEEKCDILVAKDLITNELVYIRRIHTNNLCKENK